MLEQRGEAGAELQLMAQAEYATLTGTMECMDTVCGQKSVKNLMIQQTCFLCHDNLMSFDHVMSVGKRYIDLKSWQRCSIKATHFFTFFKSYILIENRSRCLTIDKMSTPTTIG